MPVNLTEKKCFLIVTGEEKKRFNIAKTGDCKWNMKKDKGEEQIMESAHPRASRQRSVCEKSKIMLKQIRRKYSTERF